MRLSVFLIILLGSVCGFGRESGETRSIIDVPFEVSMGGGGQELKLSSLSSEDAARFSKLKEVYDKVDLSQGEAPMSIPKIFHQLWIGPKTPPEYIFSNQEQLMRLHPDWEYHLWSDADVEALQLEDWDLVEKSSSFGEKADIIRSNILDRFGGVFLDADMRVCCSLDDLAQKVDFFAGFEAPRDCVGTQNRLWIGVAIIGVRPGHPIIKEWRRRIRHGWDEVEMLCTSPIERVMQRTFYPFTKAVMQEIQTEGNRDIVFPATYFFPLAPEFSREPVQGVGVPLREKFSALLEALKIKSVPPFSRVRPETMACHSFAGEWKFDNSEKIHDLVKMSEWTLRDVVGLADRMEKLDQRLSAHEHEIEVCEERKT